MRDNDKHGVELDFDSPGGPSVVLSCPACGVTTRRPMLEVARNTRVSCPACDRTSWDFHGDDLADLAQAFESLG